jgi:hypothetical protein
VQNNVKNCDFYLGKVGDFIVFVVIGQPKGPIAKQKKTIKTFVLWDTPQLISIINMNHNKYNKYLSSCRSYNK